MKQEIDWKSVKRTSWVVFVVVLSYYLLTLSVKYILIGGGR